MQIIDHHDDSLIAQGLNDDALIARLLGPRYIGRRFLRYSEIEELGLVDNRATLKLWMDAGTFPRGIKIAGRYGKVLVWSVVEIVECIAQHMDERDEQRNIDEATE